jgi:hypothetical protein
VSSGKVDAGKINGVSAASVTTINANVGSTQPFNFTGTGGSALAKSDMVDVAGAAVSATTAQLGVNVVNWNNTVVATPATAGIPDINVKNMNNVAGTSITTINANQGTTQPINFTGTAGSALAKSDMVDVAGSAVSTSSAQIGVNVVNAGATAWASGAITAASIASNAITSAKIASGAIANATFAADTGLNSVRSNTAQAGAATTITLDAGASATNDYYKNDVVYITGGTGVGQARFISGYVGSTKVATVGTWATNPDNTSTFAILPFDAIAGASAPTTAQIATAVWEDTFAGGDFATAGSVGKMLANVDGNGYLKVDLVDIAGAAVSSSSAQLGVNVVTNGDKTGYALTSGERTSVADAVLDRDMSVGTDSGSPTVRTVRQALRVLRNAWTIVGSTQTVYKEDDTTASWSQVLTATPGADPVTATNPAG